MGTNITVRDDAPQSELTPGVVRYSGTWRLHPVGLTGPSSADNDERRRYRRGRT